MSWSLIRYLGIGIGLGIFLPWLMDQAAACSCLIYTFESAGLEIVDFEIEREDLAVPLPDVNDDYTTALSSWLNAICLVEATKSQGLNLATVCTEEQETDPGEDGEITVSFEVAEAAP